MKDKPPVHRNQVNGSWSSKGCSLINRTDTKVVCSCNHLTNFAILMQLGEAKVSCKVKYSYPVVLLICIRSTVHQLPFVNVCRFIPEAV